MPSKIKLVVSDFHIGRGRRLPNGSANPLEDFFYDGKFIEFLQYYRTGEFAAAQVELICNGDFFNHLQLDLFEPSPDVISEPVALRRMMEIFKGHPELFAEMKQFAAISGHRITFILGNHDPGLLFPAVVQKLREVLGETTSVKLDAYRFDQVHIEHGHQFFADNAYNPDRWFLTKGLPEPIVNLPWGSYFIIHFLNKVRRERPYFHKIYPLKYYWRWALIHDTLFAIRSVARIVFYFIWLRFRKDPHRRSSIIRTIQIIKQVGLAPNLTQEAKKLLLTEKDLRIVILSHTHHAVLRQFAPDKTYLNTGVWNEQISLEITNPGKVVRFTYALLEYDGAGRPQPFLKEWKGTHRLVEDFVD